MKTQINNLLKIGFLAVFAILSLTINAQSYYTPGQVYSIRNKIDDTHTLKVEFVFDASGNATITKTMVSSISSDKTQSAIFCDDERMNLSTETGCVTFNGDLTNFWVINIENVDNSSAPLGGGICFKCPCKEQMDPKVAGGDCKVSDMNDGGSLHNLTCVVTATCMTCGELKSQTDNGIIVTDQMLIIQANSINFN